MWAGNLVSGADPRPPCYPQCRPHPSHPTHTPTRGSRPRSAVRLPQCRNRLDDLQLPQVGDVHPDLPGLADDLAAAWKSPQTTMRTRQRLVRTLITEIVADVDEKAGDIVLVIHWKGGQHSELRMKKPKSGEHGCRTPEQALAMA